MRNHEVGHTPVTVLGLGLGTGTVTGRLSGYARQIDADTHPGDDSTVDTHLATMEHLIHESEALGVSAALPGFIKALTDQAVAPGARRTSGIRSDWTRHD